jgi:hypothetical protein
LRAPGVSGTVVDKTEILAGKLIQNRRKGINDPFTSVMTQILKSAWPFISREIPGVRKFSTVIHSSDDRRALPNTRVLQDRKRRLWAVFSIREATSPSIR